MYIFHKKLGYHRRMMLYSILSSFMASQERRPHYALHNAVTLCHTLGLV